ncbi:MAG: FecR domain-containing protein [Delftia acidovorans]|nr:FecR domain-containing protein [Delftia acidovorans]MBL8355331.1 FecR domain-containing protein [Delftia acidovorans]
MTLTPELVELHARASAYFVRRRAADWTGADEREFDAWLAADARHRRIYDSLGRTALDLQQLRRPRLAADAASPMPVRAASASPGVRQQAPAPRAQGRRAFVPALLSVALLGALGGWNWWDNHPGHVSEIATGPGQVREVELPDGSKVTLNFSSRLQVRYYPRRRETVLDQGEAFFQVAADRSRPFTVDSGASQVRVVGTAFNVRAGPPALVVKVLEGKVELRPDRHSPDGLRLLLGAGAGMSVDARDGTRQPLAAGADTVGDWRSGHLVFQQAPLTQVAADLARYLGQPVRVDGDARLAALSVSGVALTGKPEVFLRSLPHLLPVRVQAEAQGGWRISAY